MPVTALRTWRNYCSVFFAIEDRMMQRFDDKPLVTSSSVPYRMHMTNLTFNQHTAMHLEAFRKPLRTIRIIVVDKYHEIS